MPRDSTATRARILEAATAEFSAHGLAGARVDRIAERAEANKQLIYAYFQSKEGLFDSALELNIEQLLDAVPFDAADLPGYTRRLVDFHAGHPELGRLALWHSLERPGRLASLAQVAESMARKLACVVEAQAEGHVDPSLDPAQVLTIVVGMAHSAAFAGISGLQSGSTGPDLGDAVALAVRRLITPVDGGA